ncbi:enoyl-CoA hydratase/isomerase family protein [Candidatus Bathyarchaeota archaeon]|nr:enoyl-CoA hydratase/isomerase family protein [Candidatus Bathyarchaeota archaeon]
MREEIISKIEEGICWVTLNRPEKLNAITPSMLEEIQKVIKSVEVDDDVRCVIITGAGERAFSAGLDISMVRGFSRDEALELSRRGHSTFSSIMSLPKPTIAAVNGYALGGGCELALACDLRIASQNARFGQPEIGLGLIPGWGATSLLPRIIGYTRAMELIMTGRIIDAEEAFRIGLINRVVPAEKLLAETKGLASTLANGPATALAEAKRLLNSQLKCEEALEAEAESFGGLFCTEDFREGFSAFLERRKPVFGKPRPA